MYAFVIAEFSISLTQDYVIKTNVATYHAARSSQSTNTMSRMGLATVPTFESASFQLFMEIYFNSFRETS